MLMPGYIVAYRVTNGALRDARARIPVSQSVQSSTDILRAEVYVTLGTAGVGCTISLIVQSYNTSPVL